MSRSVRTRFAPSPTGFIHVGSVYQILINYAFARKHKGSFILRIEDTDRKRYVKEAEEKIREGLEWLGLIPDESPWRGGKYGPYRQSERLEFYQKYAKKLVKEGKAYYCFCSVERLERLRQEQKRKGLRPHYDRHCRKIGLAEAEERIAKGEKAVVRMIVPDSEKIIVPDLLRGNVEFNSYDLDDQIILKSDGFPTYHLAVVVDDHLMKITHVVRGEEWLSSAPKHVLLYRYLGWKLPVLIHAPILRNPDRSKMSKREGHTSLFWYKEQGFLPEALLNFLALLGWSHPKGKEIFDLEEFIANFDLKDISPIGPVFDPKKLEWMNGEYIRQKSDRELTDLLGPFLSKMDDSLIAKAVPLIKERIKKLSEAKDLLQFVWQPVDYPRKLLLQRGVDAKTAVQMLQAAKKIIAGAGRDETEKLQEELLSLIKKNGWKTGAFFMILRVAICGKTITPPIVESLALLGKKEIFSRLDLAIEKLC
jgi:glutamyl-tRNA synthetase